MIRFGTRLCESAHFTDLHDTDARLVSKMSHPARAIRLDTHRVRIGSADGILLNLSTTGALVRLPRLFAVEENATLSFYADNHWLDVPCRIVRCTETDVQMAGAVWNRKEFETAVSFRDANVLDELLKPEGEA